MDQGGLGPSPARHHRIRATGCRGSECRRAPRRRRTRVPLSDGDRREVAVVIQHAVGGGDDVDRAGDRCSGADFAATNVDDHVGDVAVEHVRFGECCVESRHRWCGSGPSDITSSVLVGVGAIPVTSVNMALANTTRNRTEMRWPTGV